MINCCNEINVYDSFAVLVNEMPIYFVILNSELYEFCNIEISTQQFQLQLFYSNHDEIA